MGPNSSAGTVARHSSHGSSFATRHPATDTGQPWGGDGSPTIPAPAGLPVVPGYSVRRQLDRGGMGVVYEAVAVGLNRPVALKLLSEDLLTRPDFCDRFRDEAEAVARLAHPNVVQVYEVGVHDGRPFLAMELVPGGSLAARLSEGPLPVAATVDLVRALARAVQHAHDRGVIHRDLKPANVLLGGEPRAVAHGSGAGADPGTPKLTDFGLAKLLDRADRRTHTGMLLGTPEYMAPEVVAGGPRAASPAADVYGLGAILYECLTARPPAAGGNTWATLRVVVDSDPEPPGRLRPDVVQALDAVCLKALAKDPTERYPSARALAEDLDRLATGRPVLARGSARQLLRGLWRRPAVRAGCVAAAALAAALLLFGFLDYRARYWDGVEADRVGRELLGRGAYREAERVFARGHHRVAGLLWADRITSDLSRGLRQSQRGWRAAELHRLVDRLRFGYDADSLAGADRRAVVDACDALWAARESFAPVPGTDLGRVAEDRLRSDLLDLALLSADFRVREGGRSPEAADTALRRLDEAVGFLGPDPVLTRVRAVYRGEPDLDHPDPADPAVSTWELYALGRARLNGNLERAAEFLRRAVDRDPRGFWPNFHLAICAYRRGRPEEAVAGFSACLTLAHGRRGLCYYHRGLAYAALGRRDAAIHDFDRALELEPDLAEAAFQRGLLYRGTGRFPEAVTDLERALANGYTPAVVYYHLADIHFAAGDLPAARADAARAAEADPTHERAGALLERLRNGH